MLHEDREMSADDKVRVLVIDGYREDRRYWADCLRMLPKQYEITEAQDGQSGIQQCQAQPVQCIVLEILLPDMSGFSVLRGLLHMLRPSKLAIVVLTRIEYPTLLDLSQRNGAMVSLTKAHTTCSELHRAISSVMTMTRYRTTPGANA
jgi:PleD family two-component response regulator